MAEIHEAPIMHGRISVNNIHSNGISNSVVTTAINNITTPSLDNFNRQSLIIRHTAFPPVFT